jgi:hypothetical protein
MFRHQRRQQPHMISAAICIGSRQRRCSSQRQAVLGPDHRRHRGAGPVYGSRRPAGHGGTQTPTPQQLLADRFARGEIDEEEYTRRLEVLGAASRTRGPGG